MAKTPASTRLSPLLLALSLGLTGCLPPQAMNGPGASDPVVRVSGHGAASTDPGLSPTQRHLMGVRAAKVDAYRNLAEQVNGLKVAGTSTVGELAAQNDSVRTFVEAYLRGARVVSTDLVSNGMYEAIVELHLAPTFYQGVEYPQSGSWDQAPGRTDGPGGSSYYYAP
ncbi:MAG: LPP20 family lipoprotein [Halothiobacillaceae bacterium]|jgi:hypothetical protein|nr:LPP20 family lipoprotein [Halothiobacillaceae bacterium]MDY0050412.1 LPP20 family lipoprotein [Halothiobacillaceae bacterium]